MNPLSLILRKILPIRSLKAPALFAARLAGGGRFLDGVAAAMAPLELGPSVRTESRVPLKRSRIALVTTAGFFVKGDLPFRESGYKGDFGFRIIPRDIVLSRLGLGKSGFDRRLALLDPNVVFPLDRLKELKEQKEIGEVAAHHFSFAAWCDDTVPLAGGSAKEAARRMRYEGTDKAVILPASLLSQESAVIVQRVIEAEGIPTVSLIYGRRAAEALKPPRFIVTEGAPLSRSEEFLAPEAQRALLLRLLRKFEPLAEAMPHAAPDAPLER